MTISELIGSLKRIATMSIAMSIAMSTAMSIAMSTAMSIAMSTAMSIAAVCVADAQDDIRARYGVFGHAALSSHSADFLRMPNTQSCCSGYTGGYGTGLAGGALVEFPISQGVQVGARIALLTQPFSMTSSESTLVLVGGVEQDGAFEHRLSGSFMTLGLEPLIGVRVFRSMFVHAGARIAFAVSSSYEQMDVLTLPERTGTFVNTDGTDSRKRTRNEFSGAVPGAALQISPMVGISYELALNIDRSLLIVPEGFYQLGMMNVMADSTWKASTFRVGIALKWSPRSNKSEPPERASEPVLADRIPTPSAPAPAPAPPLVQQVAPPLLVSLRTISIGADGAEQSRAKFIVEDYASMVMTPLLPYIFFDENSDRIPTRYQALQQTQIDSFDLARANTGDKLDTYHHLLNIVGKRMREYPTAAITLTGHTQDVHAEKENVELGARRAEAVKRYLVDAWGIAEGRIKTEARALPVKAANTLTQDGSEENRRVELHSIDGRLLAAMIKHDTLRTANPPSIQFLPAIGRLSDLASWTLTIKQNDNVLRVFEGMSVLPERIDWNLDAEKSSIPRTDEQGIATFTAIDSKGTTASVSEPIKVEQVSISRKRAEGRGDKVVDRFSLIIFDVRSSELQPEHKPALDVIRKHISPTSTITITGYTDRLGDARFNQTLAASRAATVSEALGVRNATVKGIGQADLYDSTLPEGRLYTRTVEVVITTPTKQE